MDNKYFSFFESYHKSFKGLPPKVIGEIILAMGNYYFDGEETELKGTSKIVFELIKPVLESSRKKSENGAKGGAPKGNTNALKTSKKQAKNKQKQATVVLEKQAKTSDKEKDKDKEKGDKEKKTPTESKKRTMSEIVKGRNLDPRLEEKVLEWLKYKTERREGYKETGLNSLITEIQHNVDEHGLDPVLNCMTTSMGRGYKGIIFELIEKGHGDNRASPKGTKFTNFEERNYTEIDDLENRLARN